MKELPVIDTIVLDGIDKCGKNLLMGVLANLDRKYILVCRGLQSCLSYDEIYDRPRVKYDFQSHRNELFVFLDIEENDWKIRCKLTNEPKIDYNEHNSVFQKTFDVLANSGLTTFRVYPSKDSVYQMAKAILDFADEMNTEPLVFPEVNN